MLGKVADSVLNQAANMSVKSIQRFWNIPRQSSNTSSLQFALIVVTGGQLVVVRTVLLEKKKLHHLWNCESYAKDCRKTNVQLKTKPRVNIVDDTIYEAYLG